MNDITIETAGNYIYLVSPYDASFPARAKAIGGRWDRARKAWRFDVRDQSRVEALAAEFWGYEPRGSGEKVTVRFKAEHHYHDGEVRFANRRIAWRTERDSPVRLAENAVVVEGHFPASGGSRNSPTVSWSDEGAVVELRDIPASMLELEPEDSYEIVDGDPGKALREERERLVKRLAQIDELLGEKAAEES
jgi:hypothetical protein